MQDFFYSLYICAKFLFRNMFRNFRNKRIRKIFSFFILLGVTWKQLEIRYGLCIPLCSTWDPLLLPRISSYYKESPTIQYWSRLNSLWSKIFSFFILLGATWKQLEIRYGLCIPLCSIWDPLLLPRISSSIKNHPLYNNEVEWTHEMLYKHFISY